MNDETVGARYISDYRLGRKAGTGGFGNVWEAVNTKTDLECAFKQIVLDHYEKARVQEALYAVQSARDTQHVVGVLDFFEHTTEDGRQTFCIVTALVRHGHLGEFIQRKMIEKNWPLPLPEALRIALGIARGLAAIHKLHLRGDSSDGNHAEAEGICHLDLKPSNIMIDRKDEQDIPMITDFGLARSADSVYVGGGCTPGYAAPEQMNARQEKGQHSDRFSFGMILYELLTGKPAVYLTEPVSRKQARLREYAEWTATEKQPSAPSVVREELQRWPELDDLVFSLLDFDPDARKEISTASIVQTLQTTLREIETGIKANSGHARHTTPTMQHISDAPYVAGTIPLPFDCVALKILHDQQTAVVGGVDGRIAAINLKTGALICTTPAEDSTQSHVGGGENHYVGGSYFFLELAPARQCFYTMSHSAVLKTWMFDGNLRQLSAIPLLTPHFSLLRSEILKVKQGGWRNGRWSGWTCYSQDVPDVVPSGLLDAKLSPDGSAILCLTEWFAIFRCDLAGRLRDSPKVIGDVFAIEPANADASEFWVGRSTSGWCGLFRTGFRIKDAANSCRIGDFGFHGIHTLSDNAIVAGGIVVDIPKLSRLESSELWLGLGLRPLPLPKQQCVLAAAGSMVRAHNIDTLRSQGEPFIAGHDGDVCALDATRDQAHLVSMSAQSMRVWDIRTRTPLGGYPPEDTFLRIGMPATSSTHFRTRDGKVYCPQRDTAAIIDMAGRSFTYLHSVADTIGIAGNTGEVQVFSVQTAEGIPLAGAKGLLAKAMKVDPPKRYLLKHHAIVSGVMLESATVELKLLTGVSFWGSYEHSIRGSVAIDLGDGRVALLVAGHVAIYDFNTRTIVAGPLEISRPSEDATEWTYYTQLAASADGTRVFVRGRDRVIKVLDSMNLRSLGEIPGTAGGIGLLLPLSDSRHVIYSSGSDNSRDLSIADSSTMTVVGKLCELNSSAPEDPCRAVLLGGGTMLALSDYRNNVRLLNLLNGKYDQEPIAVHSASILSMHHCPNGTEILTVSADGSSRFWSLHGRVEEICDPIAALRAAAKTVK